MLVEEVDPEIYSIKDSQSEISHRKDSLIFKSF